MAASSGQPQIPTLADFLPASVRGAPGFFRVGRTRQGAWWLIDPHDRGFFAKAVSGVSEYGRQTAGWSDTPDEAYLRTAVPRLRQWHFNTLGAWSAGSAEASMYRVAMLDFKSAGPRIHLLDMDLPDVFSPDWVEAIRTWARRHCAPWLGRRDLIGYFTDDDLRWAQPDAEYRTSRPGLLQLCLSLEPSAGAYHAAWEFVLAAHRGELSHLARAWALPLANREAIRQLTLAERAIDHPLYLEDEYRFSREFARRYHALTTAVIREQDEQHLILGARWRGWPGQAVLREASYPGTDVISLSWPDFEHWPESLAGALGGVESPVWLCGVAWHPHPTPDEALRPGAAHHLERRLREGSQALQVVVTDPSLVAYEWNAWRHPADSAPYFLGLVHADDHPVPEHTDVLKALNSQMERWRDPYQQP